MWTEHNGLVLETRDAPQETGYRWNGFRGIAFARRTLEPQVSALLQRVRSAFRGKWFWSAVCALTAGLALRIVWIVFWADFDGDSEVYAILARNMLCITPTRWTIPFV